MAALLKALDIDPAHVLAIGDAENDVEVRCRGKGRKGDPIVGLWTRPRTTDRPTTKQQPTTTKTDAEAGGRAGGDGQRPGAYSVASQVRNYCVTFVVLHIHGCMYTLILKMCGCCDGVR